MAMVAWETCTSRLKNTRRPRFSLGSIYVHVADPSRALETGELNRKRRLPNGRCTQEKPETETKIKGPVSGYLQSGNKQTADRMANKQRKKRAHKRNLRRSHANG